MVNTVSRLNEHCGVETQANDWAKLAGLPEERSYDDVKRLFYPGSEGDMHAELSRLRRRDFLTSANDNTYRGLYEFVQGTPNLVFADVHAMLKTTKYEGKAMSLVMAHVGRWLNRDPARVGERDSNKPPLRNDFLPALERSHGSDAERQSRVLQQQILTYVKDNMEELTNPALEHFLHEFPGGGQEDTYAARFQHRTWKEILVIVRALAGPHFQNEAVLRFNDEDPNKICSRPTSAIAQAVCDFVARVPEVSQNPALKAKKAIEALCAEIEPVVVEWAARQCDDALGSRAKEWSASTVKLVEAERAKYKALVDAEVRLPAGTGVHPSGETSSPRSSPDLGGRLDGAALVRSSGSSAERERPGMEGAGDEPSARPVDKLDPGPSHRLEDPMAMTAEGLRTLRKSHRKKRAVAWQEAAADGSRAGNLGDRTGNAGRRVAPVGYTRGPTSEQPRPRVAPKGGRSWRQRPAAHPGGLT